MIPRFQVNTAARMETTSEPGRVHLSESSAALLLRSPPADLRLEPRGPRAIKGKVEGLGHATVEESAVAVRHL